MCSQQACQWNVDLGCLVVYTWLDCHHPDPSPHRLQFQLPIAGLVEQEDRLERRLVRPVRLTKRSKQRPG